jgi:transcriptional regulator with XRE-family HTH domain
MRTKDQNPAIDTDWFKEQLRIKRLSLRALAQRLGISPSAASYMIRGVSKIPQDKAQTMADLFGVDLLELYKRMGAPIDDAQRSVPVEYCMTPERTIVRLPVDEVFEVAAPFETRASSICLQIRTTDMYDQWLLFTQGPKLDVKDAVNQLCLYEDSSSEFYVAVIRSGYKKGTYDAHSAFNDGKVIQDVHVAWAAPIAWIKPALN